MIAARESDLRVLFKPFPESREGGCHLRIWLPREIPEHCGVVLMFHGGAFAAGQDSDVPHAEVEYLNSNGVVVISAQYRLLPHVQFPEILEDLLDAYQWVWRGFPDHVPGTISVTAVAVEGWSAGATASCLVGAYHQKRSLPRPAGLYLHYGYFDQQVPFGGKGLADRVHDVDLVLQEPMETGVPHDRGGEPGTSDRSKWLVSAMVNNTLPYYLNPDTSVGHVPPTYNPLDLITSSFPPCFVLVATKDSLIPPKQSYDFIAKLREHQVDHEFTEADMEHGQSEVALKEQVPGEYEAWFTNHIRFGLDWTIGRLDHCASQNGP